MSAPRPPHLSDPLRLSHVTNQPTTPSAPLMTPTSVPTPKDHRGPPIPLNLSVSGSSQPVAPSTPTSESFKNACLWAASQPQFKDTPIITPLPQVASGPPPKEPVRPKGKKIDADDIQLVQGLIEKCLQLYMNQTEVITALRIQANIEPGFTALVWQKLEDQNPLFFKAYAIRLRIKEQIAAFNYLVSQQAQLAARNQGPPAPVVASATPALPGTPKAAAKQPPGFAALSNPLKGFSPATTPSHTPVSGSPAFPPLAPTAATAREINSLPPLNFTTGSGSGVLGSASFPSPLLTSSTGPALLKESKGSLSLSNAALPLGTDFPDLDTNQFFESIPSPKQQNPSEH